MTSLEERLFSEILDLEANLIKVILLKKIMENRNKLNNGNFQ